MIHKKLKSVNSLINCNHFCSRTMHGTEESVNERMARRRVENFLWDQNLTIWWSASNWNKNREDEIKIELKWIIMVWVKIIKLNI